MSLSSVSLTTTTYIGHENTLFTASASLKYSANLSLDPSLSKQLARNAAKQTDTNKSTKMLEICNKQKCVSHCGDLPFPLILFCLMLVCLQPQLKFEVKGYWVRLRFKIRVRD